MPISPSRTEGARPPVRPTAWTAIALAVVLGALTAWGIAVLYRAADATPAVVPWLTPVGLAVLVVFLALLGRGAHRRIQVRHEHVELNRAVVWLALGKAAALGGAAVAGGYLSYGLNFVSRLDAELPRERVLVSFLTAGTGVALVVVGLLLERACRVPEDPDQESSRS